MFLLHKIAKNFAITVKRFPIPLMVAFLACLFVFISLHGIKKGSEWERQYVFVKLALECISGISLFIAFDFFAESKLITFSKRVGLALLGFSILGLHYYSITPGMFDAESIFISRFLLFSVCFHLLISFVPFYHQSEIKIFWQYNYFLFKNICQSLLFSITLFLGLSSSLWAVGKLFGFHFSDNYYLDIGVIVLILFNVIYFLINVPQNFDSFKEEKPFSNWIRVFVQYILLPITGIYLLILYIYLAKMLLTHHLPNGWVCVPILIFSILGILAYLLIYPIRNDSNNKLIFLFAKYFFYLLLPLLTLLFISIVHRIIPYGITEDRYLVFILGMWLLILAVYIITSTKDNIIIIPVSLFCLLALSAIGPWGMFQLSVQNQFSRLERTLKRNHLLVGNKLQVMNSSIQIAEKDASSIRSILWYLNKRGEMGRIHTWLDDKDQVKLKTALENDDLHLIHAIFGSGELDQNPDDDYLYTLMTAKQWVSDYPLSVENYKHFITFETSGDRTPLDYLQGDSSRIECLIHQKNLIFLQHHDTLALIDLSQKVKSLLAYQFEQDSIQLKSEAISHSIQLVNKGIREFSFPADSMILNQHVWKIYLQNFQISKLDSIYKLEHVQGIMLY